MNAAAILLLAEKGLSALEIAEVAAALEVRRDPTAADRMARMRERKRNGVTRNVTPNVGSNERDNLTSREEKNSEPKGSSQKFILPSDIPGEPWDGFEEMRRRIRKPLTNKGRSLAVTELRRLRDEEGWPPGDVLNHCTMNSYQGIWPPKRNAINERSSNPTAEALHRILGNS